MLCNRRRGKKKNGDLDTLKLVVHNAIMNGEVERFVMVGGDPYKRLPNPKFAWAPMSTPEIGHDYLRRDMPEKRERER